MNWSNTNRALLLLQLSLLLSGVSALGMTSPPPPSVRTTTLAGGLEVSKIGVGTWAWGDKFYWKYSEDEDKELQKAFDYCKDNGVTFFDTAEVYGFGKSELLLSRFERYKPEPKAIVATKFAPLPWRFTADSVVAACRDSMDRLGTDKIDLYQLHWPGLVNEAYWDGIAKCYERGWISAVGVSNYGPSMLKDAHRYLTQRGVPLATNQVQFSLLCRSALSNGLLRTAQDLNVTILAYSPLAQGALCGKYTADNIPRGPRRAILKATISKSKSLVDLMSDIAVKQSEAIGKEVSVSQVALNWCVAKGTIPIPGIRSLSQAKDNCDTLNWSLNPEDVLKLDTAASETGVNIPTPLQRS